MPHFVHIQSLEDPRVDVFRDVRDRDLRGREHLFMAESELVVRRLAASPERLHAVMITPGKLDRLLVELDALPPHVPVYIADLDVMSVIAGFHVHRGVLAAGLRPTDAELTLDHALGHLRDRSRLRIVIAEGFTNVDNMGGLFRTAAAFGVDGILLDPTCCDPLYRKAIRVSMGHALSVPYAVSTNWHADLDRLREQWGITLFAAEITDRAAPLWDMHDVEKLALLFGAEGHGVRDDTLAHCDGVYHIPMAKGVPSLNVVVAIGCALYELGRSHRGQAPF